MHSIPIFLLKDADSLNEIKDKQSSTGTLTKMEGIEELRFSFHIRPMPLYQVVNTEFFYITSD